MSRKPNYIPTGYHTVTPFLTVGDVSSFIDFCRQAFGAEVKDSMSAPNGSIVHAEVKIGDSILMVGPVMGDQPGRPGNLYLYVTDVDATYARALGAGATSMEVPTDEFWGDRAAGVTDAFGNGWWIATKIEELSHDEIQKRSDAMLRRAAPTG
jgi:PhnB protein